MNQSCKRARSPADSPAAPRPEAYFLVGATNHQVQALRGVFLDSQVIAVGHTEDPLPDGAVRYIPAAPIRQLTTVGYGAVVSELVNGTRRFLVIVNRDVLRPLAVEIECDFSAAIERISKEEGELLSLPDGRLRTELEPGDGCVLTWVIADRSR